MCGKIVRGRILPCTPCTPRGKNIYTLVYVPGSSEVPRNPLTRWDVSSIPVNGIFHTKKLKNKIKMPNGWTQNSTRERNG